MKKIDWTRKLTSRKFWVALVGLITGIMMIFGASAEYADKIGGVILMFGSVVGYILGEGLTDAAHGGDTEAAEDPGDEEPAAEAEDDEHINYESTV